MRQVTKSCSFLVRETVSRADALFFKQELGLETLKIGGESRI